MPPERTPLEKAAHDLLVVVYQVTAKFPKNETAELARDLRRLAQALQEPVVLGSRKEDGRHLAGFLARTEDPMILMGPALELARELGYLSDGELQDIEIRLKGLGDQVEKTVQARTGRAAGFQAGDGS